VIVAGNRSQVVNASVEGVQQPRCEGRVQTPGV
jgi:hypothetical protein